MDTVLVHHVATPRIPPDGAGGADWGRDRSMTNDWMLDVLANMRGFALMNGMTDLAEQLERAAEIAKRDAVQARDQDRDARKAPREPRAPFQNPPSR